MKEGNDVSAYLTEANDIKDRLQSLGKETPNKTMISIILNGLPKSNKMVIQGASLIFNPSFEDIIDKILTKNHRLAMREHKLGPEDTLSIQKQRPLNPQFQTIFHIVYRGGGLHGRGYFSQGTFLYAPLHIRPFYRPPLAHIFRGPIPMASPSRTAQLRGICPNTLIIYHPGHNFYPRAPRNHIICYNCGGEGHIARKYSALQLTNYVEGDYFVGFVDHNTYSSYYNTNQYMDLGASSHVTRYSSNVEFLDQNIPTQHVITANRKIHRINVVGSRFVTLVQRKINLIKVFHVPAFKRNLMSFGTLVDEGRIVISSDSQFFILNNAIEKRVILTSYRNCFNGLYTFTNKEARQIINHIISNFQLGNYSHCNIVTNQNTSHAKFGHLHYGRLQHLSIGNRVIGLPNISFKHIVCESYLVGKQHREPLTWTPRKTESAKYQTLFIQILQDQSGLPPLEDLDIFQFSQMISSRRSYMYFLKKN